MVTLHLLQLLADNNFGVIDKTLFWEKLPIDGHGVAIYSRGGPMPARGKMILSIDFYSRGSNDLLGADKLEKIHQFFENHMFICDLPEISGKSVKKYRKVHITPESNIENLGQDETDRLIFRSSYQIKYIKES